MSKYRVALFIGRFQPFHNGHLFSLQKSLEIAEKVIVGIGSSQESRTASNPWSFEERKKMIEVVSKEVEIVSLPDTPSDDVWLKEVKQRVSDFEVVVSNNEWVLSIMKEAGYPVFESGLYNRDELEGVKIRELMRNGGKWESRVPVEVASQIDMGAI